ncbi:hypothetical protein [Sporosarcina ureae]|uniref:hypothetical protein n=1 Tax=Sporosarcina ureae TaxID=1571 RepID=UPI0028A816AB|nr:hypothetical protein [Sporosarcina ureae]
MELLCRGTYYHKAKADLSILFKLDMRDILLDVQAGEFTLVLQSTKKPTDFEE